MNAFAGFWVDGAVRKPETPSDGTSGRFVYRWKTNKLCAIGSVLGWGRFEEVEWLDTTPRESLTPEELWSLLRVIWVGQINLHKNADDSWYVDEITDGVKVDWGNLTQYPPPVEPQWIRITRENVGQYLFRECRFRDANESWYDGHVVGWDIIDDCCLVSSDRSEIEPVLQWEIVEVQA